MVPGATVDLACPPMLTEPLLLPWAHKTPCYASTYELLFDFCGSLQYFFLPCNTL